MRAHAAVRTIERVAGAGEIFEGRARPVRHQIVGAVVDPLVAIDRARVIALARDCRQSPTVRARICDGLGFLGIELEEKRNLANEGVISPETSRAPVRVIHTDEEWMIASTVCRVLGLTIADEHDHENGV
jgi:acetate kinase